MLKWLWVTVAAIAIDQLTKQLAVSYLDYGHPVAFIPYLDITLRYNTGAAFSFLADAGGWQRWFFAGVALAVSGWLVLWMKGLKPGQRWLAFSLALILGGALGNLWDRIYLGYVVDFIDFYVGEWHWPAFNIADSAISVGAAMLIIETLFLSRGKGTGK